MLCPKEFLKKEGMRVSEKGSNNAGQSMLAEVFSLPAAEKNSLLLEGARNDRPDLVAAALKAGADVNCSDDNGDTALIHASRQGALDAVVALLQAQADPLRRNNKGETALMASWPVMAGISARGEAGQSTDPAGDAKHAYHLGRIGGLLYQAETLASAQAVASCTTGVQEKMTVRSPLKLKPSSK